MSATLFDTPAPPPATSRLDALKAEWWVWMRANPDVFRMYESTLLDLIERDGMKRISSDYVWHLIRQKTAAQNLQALPGHKFKLNNNYTSLMSRYFTKLYPQYADRLEQRELKSGSK